jgi:adenosylcobinamide-phosphate synthase
MVPLTLGYFLDLIIGDPQNWPHPIRYIGRFVSYLENIFGKFNQNKKNKFIFGMLLWIITVSIAYLIPKLILLYAYKVNSYLFIFIESLMCYYILAVKNLKDETKKVYDSLIENDLQKSRKSLSMIVGRDTENLDKESIVKAAVETVSENISDGIIAPMLFIALGGAPLGFAYKAANTLDSMVGYKNEKYYFFGKFSAVADDFLNYFPSRISGLLIVFSSLLLKYNYKNSWKIFIRDRKKHASPNSAQSESAAAGALNIRLGGPNYYHGVLVEKPFIGDSLKSIEVSDILKVFKLMYTTSFLGLLLSLAIIYFLG